MTKSRKYTASEILSILSARQLQDGQVVFAGIGVPLLAATLAQRTRCPALTILSRAAWSEPSSSPEGSRRRPNDQRCTKRANMVLGSADVLSVASAGIRRRGIHGWRADRSVR